MSAVAVLVVAVVGVLFWRQVAAVLLVVLVSLVLGGVAYFTQMMNSDGYPEAWASVSAARPAVELQFTHQSR